jgi:hypothetical protein
MADARNCETVVTAFCTLEPRNESSYFVFKIRSNYGDIVESKIMWNFSLSFDLMEITKNNQLWVRNRAVKCTVNIPTHAWKLNINFDIRLCYVTCSACTDIKFFTYRRPRYTVRRECIYGYVLYTFVGRGSVVGIATDYGLDGPGIESPWGRDFPHLSRPFLGPIQPPVQWVPSLSRG